MSIVEKSKKLYNYNVYLYNGLLCLYDRMDIMMKLKSKRIIKGLVSLLLVFTVMVSLAAPFDIVKAIEDETPATDYDIYAKVYKIDSSNSSNTNNHELVIQKGNDTDSSRVLVAEYNNYNKTQYYGGCMCSFNQVQSLAIPVTQSDN